MARTEPPPPFDPPPSRRLYLGAVVRVGEFRLPAAHVGWQIENWIGPMPHVVFPRVPVVIHQAGRDPATCTANHVVFYNAEQIYTRRLLSERGDECEWFAVQPDVLVEAIRPYDPTAVDRPIAPLTFAVGPSDARSYLAQRTLHAHLLAADPPDPVFVEETFLALLQTVIGQAYAVRGCARRPGRSTTVAEHRRVVEDAKAFAAARLAEPLRLEEIAAQVGVSVFHLCRVFRAHAGMPLHQYLRQLRLRAALERIAEKGLRLVDVALAAGFSNHSHLTREFVREFGLTPTQIRAAFHSGRGGELSKFVKASA